MTGSQEAAGQGLHKKLDVFKSMEQVGFITLKATFLITVGTADVCLTGKGQCVMLSFKKDKKDGWGNYS